MSDNRSSYRTIIKGTAIFGGVQVFNILINILRGKFVAILLGPAGMGISTLFSSTTNTISQFTSFGLNFSAVREISTAKETGDINRLDRTAQVLRTLVFFLGILAAIIIILGAPWLSKVAFGNYEHIWGFVALSVMLFFSAKSAAETTLLQGTRSLKCLAKASIIGSVTGLVSGIPLYYFFGVKGIVPAMIILALVSYSANKYFSKKLQLSHQHVTFKDAFKEGKQMLSLGIVMMAATLIGTVTLYITNVYIRKHGSLDDIGLYQAATSITNQYVGLIFTAMSVDYFPRLAAISHDKLKVRETVTHQVEIVMLIITPLLIGIIVTAPILIRILLAKEFLSIAPLVRLLGMCLFFKAFAYPIGYISFSKGDKKAFFWLEGVFGNTKTLIFNIIGYTMGGLIGLGVSFILSIILYLIVLLIFVKIRYDFTISRKLLLTIMPLFLALSTSLTVFHIYQESLFSYLVSTIFLVLASYYSYRMLDERVDIKDFVLSKIRKK